MLKQDEKLTTLNELFDQFKEHTAGMYHNALWQIIINESCTGAFLYVHTAQQVGVAQRDGGYIPCGFDIPDASKRDEIIDELNLKIFGLTRKGALDVECESFRNNKRKRVA